MEVFDVGFDTGIWSFGNNIINGIYGRSEHELDKESKGKVVVYGETYH
jgi:hypothetical protein